MLADRVVNLEEIREIENYMGQKTYKLHSSMSCCNIDTYFLVEKIDFSTLDDTFLQKITSKPEMAGQI